MFGAMVTAALCGDSFALTTIGDGILLQRAAASNWLMVSLAAGVPLACRTSPKYCKRDDPQEPTAKVPYPEAPIADLIERHEILPGADTYDPSGH